MANPNPQPLLKGQIAIVTGATGGIGSATARLLASLGCSVTLHFNTDEDAASALKVELTEQHSRRHGSKVLAVGADLGNYDDVCLPIIQVVFSSTEHVWQVHGLHRRVVSLIGAPTILINNAGSTGGHVGVQAIEQVPVEDFERTWRVNCGSSYLLTRVCLPAMEKAGWGRVVFLSSVAGITGGIIGPHYA